MLSDAPIFIVGHGRSGTTLLRLMLCAHPRIYISHEASFYCWEPMFLRATGVRKALARYFQRRDFRRLGVDPQTLLAAMPDPLPPRRIGEVYAALMREKAAQYGRARFGDKTPAHAVHLQKVFRDFPEARVIRIIRDPRAIAESLTSVPFGSPSVALNALAVRIAGRRARRFADRILTVRLEDLLADTRGVMQRVLAFVGEPWDDAVLDHPRHVPDVDDMPSHFWLQSAKREPASSTARWRSLPAAQVRLLEWMTRDEMREGGYQRASFDPEPRRLAVLAEFLRQIPRMWHGLRVLARTGAAVRGGDQAADQQFRRLNPASRAPHTQAVPAPIFVIGHSRSGTTLLRLMLCAHPRIYLTHEATFYHTEPMFLRTARVRAALAKYFRSRSFRWLDLDPEQLMAGLPDPLPLERIGEVYAALMREKAAQYGRPRFGDKTPQNSAHLHKIFRDFPEARVVRIMRDPRATAHSLSFMPFGSASVALNAMALSFDHRFAAKYLDQILTVRLEDLLTDARSVMGRVLDFVGEPWDDAVLDHSQHIPDAEQMRSPWMESPTRERKVTVEKWRTLAPAQIRLIEWLARGTMKEGGYARAALDPEPGRLAVLAEFWRQLPEIRRFMRISRRLGAAYASHGESDVTDALHRQLNPASRERYPDVRQFPPEPPPRRNAPP